MKVHSRPYTSNFYMWNGVSAMFFSSCVTIPHSHNTMQLLFDLEGGFKCKIKDSTWGKYKALAIKENVIHQLDTNDSVQLILYLDIETSIAKEISEKYMAKKDACPLDVNIFDFVKRDELQKTLLKANPPLLEKLIYQVLRSLSGEKEIPKMDERIKKIQKIVSEHPVEEITITYLADKACLSESRLRALFKKNTGASLHKYILWNKIKYATNRIMTGSTVNDAAIGAGFSDSSHFHKMMIKMFGISPSQFMKSNGQKNVLICDTSPLRFESITYNEKDWSVKQVYK